MSPLPVTPESPHEPAVVRAPAAAPKKDVRVTSLVVESTAITPRLILRYLIEAILVLSLPFVIATSIGLWQLAWPPRVPSNQTPASFDLSSTDVSFTTEDGVRIAAWDVAAKSPTSDKSAIVILPGYGMDKGGILARTAFLATRHRLLYVDFRSFGGSEGAYSTMGLTESADVIAAIRYLREQGVERVGIYGFTMGGAVAIKAAVANPDVRAVVTEDAFASYKLVAEEPYRYVGPFRPMFGWWTRTMTRLILGIDPTAASPESVAPALRIPVLVIHNRANPAISERHAELLQAALKDDPSAEIWVHAGASDIAARTAFAERVLKFFDEHLD